MKKKIHTLSLLLFFSILPLALFSSCDKDTNSYLDVLVIDEATKAPIPNAIVEIYQNNCDDSDYNYRIGNTDNNGIYSTYFEAPGIFSIRARLMDAETGGYREGTGTERVVEGETKTKQIILTSELHF